MRRLLQHAPAERVQEAEALTRRALRDLRAAAVRRSRTACAPRGCGGWPASCGREHRAARTGRAAAAGRRSCRGSERGRVLRRRWQWSLAWIDRPRRAASAARATAAMALTALARLRPLLRPRKPPPTARYAVPLRLSLAGSSRFAPEVGKPLRSFVAAGQGSLTSFSTGLRCSRASADVPSTWRPSRAGGRRAGSGGTSRRRAPGRCRRRSREPGRASSRRAVGRDDLHARELVADAEVLAEAEADVARDAAVAAAGAALLAEAQVGAGGVEAARVGEHRLVVVGRDQRDAHDLARARRCTPWSSTSATSSRSS